MAIIESGENWMVVSSEVDDKRWMIINESCDQGVLDKIDELQVDSLRIKSWQSSSLQFFNVLGKSIRNVYLDCPVLDIASINCLSQLESLSLCQSPMGVDVKGLGIRKLSISGVASVDFEGLIGADLVRLSLKGVANISDLSFVQNMLSLKELVVESKSVTRLGVNDSVPSIEFLSITVPKLKSLMGLRFFTGLRSFFVDGRGLSDVDDLYLLQRLEDLSVRNIKGVSVFARLPLLSGLRTLEISACGDVETLRMLEVLSNLEHIRLSQMRVIDGDVGFMVRMKALSTVEFENKKGYNSKCADINASLRGKGNILRL